MRRRLWSRSSPSDLQTGRRVGFVVVRHYRAPPVERCRQPLTIQCPPLNRTVCRLRPLTASWWWSWWLQPGWAGPSSRDDAVPLVAESWRRSRTAWGWRSVPGARWQPRDDCCRRSTACLTSSRWRCTRNWVTSRSAHRSAYSSRSSPFPLHQTISHTRSMICVYHVNPFDPP